jgi:hypothetical protein
MDGPVDHVLVPQDDVDALPPFTCTRVHAYCLLLGNTSAKPKISEAGVCLEREMGRLLAVKGVSQGKNTRHFGSRNMVLGMRPDQGKVKTLFQLGVERYVEYEGVTVSRRDFRRALASEILVTRK